MSHPFYIDDVSLQGYRDRLIWLLEATWSEVGLVLHTAQKAEDLCYPSIWGDHRLSLPVVAALLRSPKYLRRSDAPTLHKMRQRMLLIDQSIKDAYEVEKECTERLERVDAAFTQRDITSDQQVLLAEKRKERLQALEDASAERTHLDVRRRIADADLSNCEGYFARTEVMKFCRNRRYTINPLNAANALAGLPFIGWRQSIKRCQEWECHVGGIELFRVVARDRK